MKTLRDIDPDKLYTVAQARDLIPSTWGGGRPCRMSLYRWILGGKLRGQRYGRGWLVRGSAILDFLQVKEEEAAPFTHETRAKERQRGLAAAAEMKARWAAQGAKNGKLHRAS
jgi:hypothetical protein